jgi:hypothetical protein
VQLTQIEAAFKTLKSELGIRPLYHQLGQPVEGHILIAFLAYCLWVTLKKRLQTLASGLTPKAVLEKLATLQMLDVWLPTTDGRHLVMSRYTQPEPDQTIFLHNKSDAVLDFHHVTFSTVFSFCLGVDKPERSELRLPHAGISF